MGLEPSALAFIGELHAWLGIEDGCLLVSPTLSWAGWAGAAHGCWTFV